MLSQKSKYAIRAVLYLSSASSAKSDLKGGKDVAIALQIPLAFTMKILQELVKFQVISSTKGPGGGFFLSPENLSKPLMAIAEATGDTSLFNSCGLGLSACSEHEPCPIHEDYKLIRGKLVELFKNKTIGELGVGIKNEIFTLVR